jgi:hypothetical protein
MVIYHLILAWVYCKVVTWCKIETLYIWYLPFSLGFFWNLAAKLIALFMIRITNYSSNFKTNMPHIDFCLFLFVISIDFENILHIGKLVVITECLEITHTCLIKGYFFAFSYEPNLFFLKIITKSRVLSGFLAYNRDVFKDLTCLYHWFS